MLSRNRVGTALILCCLLALPAVAQVVEVPSEVVPGAFDASRQAAVMAAHAERLLADEGKARIAGHVVEPSAADLDRLANADTSQGRMLVGVNLPLGAEVRFAGTEEALDRRPGASQAGGPIAGGALRLDDGGFVWSTVVHAPGARAMRLHLAGVALPNGAEMWVYTRRGEAFGPYGPSNLGEQGDLWTHTVVGDELRFMVRYNGAGPERALGATRLSIADVVFFGESYLLARYLGGDEGGDATRAFCSFNASCVQNASCSSIPAAIQNAANGVAHIQFAVGSSTFICSGGLLNDQDTSTTIPYFLTANHCLSTTASANSLEAFFQFTTPCGGSCYNPDGVVPRVLGSTLLATNSSSDFTFLRLNSGPPAGSTLLGWTSAAVAFSNGTNLFRLSHPKGAPQAYSTQNVSTTAGTCGSLPRGNFIYSKDTFGGTEGGSSGSPVLNSSGQVVGQLFGACGTNVNNSCDSVSNATVDGAFAVTFSSVSSFLTSTGGGGGCHVGAPGTADFCSNTCKCEDGEGDCDSNNQCVTGTTCVSNVGPNYGWASWVDVCEAPSSNPNSCVGNCGSQAPGGCWCDSSCSFFGDCCADKFSVCG